MAGLHKSQFQNPLLNWIDSRLPIPSLIYKEYAAFPTPKNFNYFWNFGALAMVTLVIMMATGIFLAMNYQPNTALAFDSVEHIMRDVNYGWLLRYVHQNGASMFFIAVYIHMFRGMYYGSYKSPRELLWMLGVVILLLMMATAFMGYVLPWGQMSFWGATVITNLFSAFPVVGQPIVTWLWGGFSVDNPTLNRFYTLHYLLPFVIVGVVVLHVGALHITGSNNPLGIDVKGAAGHGAVPSLLHDQGQRRHLRVPASSTRSWCSSRRTCSATRTTTSRPIRCRRRTTSCRNGTSCRSTPSCARCRTSSAACALMFGSILVLFVLPWLDTSPVRSARFRPIYRQLFWLLVAGDRSCSAWCGAHKPRGHLGAARPGLHALLLLPLPGAPAAARRARAPAAAAGQHQPRRCWARGGGPMPSGAAAKPMEKA